MAASVQLVWENPDLKRKRVNIYAAALAQVKLRPGVWGRLRIFNTRSGAYSAARALTGRITDKKWQFCSARIGTTGSQYALYARYGTPPAQHA